MPPELCGDGSAFRLWHTFSSNSDYFMPRKTSDNLMDYNDGERLHKYQWDYIHNPEGGLYLFQDEEEAAYRDYSILDRIANKLDISFNTNFMLDEESGELIIQKFVISKANFINTDIDNIKEFNFIISGLFVQVDNEGEIYHKEFKTLSRKGKIELADYSAYSNYTKNDILSIDIKGIIEDYETFEYIFNNDQLLKNIINYNIKYFPTCEYHNFYDIYEDIDQFEDKNILTFAEEYGGDIINIVVEIFARIAKAENIFDANLFLQNMDLIDKHFYSIPYLKETETINYFNELIERGPIIIYE